LYYHVALEQLPQEWVVSLKAIEPNTGVCSVYLHKRAADKREIVSRESPEQAHQKNRLARLIRRNPRRQEKSETAALLV